MNSQPINIQDKIKIRFSEVMEQQQQDRGIEPLALESQLLLKRIKAGGYSGQYLANAFLSMYRNQPFRQSLSGLKKLDAEAFRLFHEILHARFIKNWSDEELYQLEQKIRSILSEQMI